MLDFEIKQNLLPASKYALKSPYTMKEVIGVTVHNTYNNAPAKNEISYMISNNSHTSFHYAVDEVEAVQGIPLDRMSWHCGATKGNMHTISVEIARSTSDLETFLKAEDNGAKLVAYLLNKYGFGIGNLYKHQDWSGKYCPHRTLDLGWDRFVNKVKGYMSLGTNEPSNPRPAQQQSASEPQGFAKWEKATFIPNCTVNVRAGTSTSTQAVAQYTAGQRINYDSVYIDNGYVWVSYIARSGNRRYVACRTYQNGKRGELWGRIE